ncbi:MAG TPA: thioredoxin-like domain-containing protein [Pyrinomonadaceae bacterium]|jgi:thiol-disulfide isomerase/thioredoxin
MKRIKITIVPCVLFILFILSIPVNSSKGFSTMSIRRQGRVRAPELAGARGWLNTERPLSLAALKGKVVLLDFWTYGCINCIHIIPDLKKLEQKYANQLVVIGVHSAKFDNEKETDNIRRIILRYELEHPVVNDADFKIWQAYAVRGWPTQVLIDPAGYVVGQISGEGNYEAIDRAISQVIEDARSRGELNEQPLKLALERARVADLPLAFPGKVLADAKSDRLFIADSNHNRIVVTRLDGTLTETIGTGERGALDGPTGRASFSRPQGMALSGDWLYVADTENHLIRRINLRARIVETVAGTGRQSQGESAGGAARNTALNSPWDLQLVGRTLYIAMAGPHQIWKLDTDAQQVSTFAGSGREARKDGPLDEAAFAQPSGLASDGRTLYVADSEANIIRAIDLTSSNTGVRTLAGGDLFEFGDVDGRGDDVRLQHPLGLSASDGKLFIADTYNHKIKQLDTASGSVKTFIGTGKPGQAEGPSASFYEPGGLSIAAGKLYVADTNNHAVRVVDLKTRQSATLVIKGLQPPATATAAALAESSTDASAQPNAEEIKLERQRIGVMNTNALVLDVALPAGYHLNPSAPQRYRVTVLSGAEHLALAGASPAINTRTAKDLQLPLRIPLRALSTGAAELRAQLTLFYCREDNTGTCQIKTLIWRAPVEVTSDREAPREIKAQAKVQ